MARPLRIEFPGAVYHLTSRGNERRDIFFGATDKAMFLKILEKTIERWSWACHAYCLMNNHYHLLVETPEPNLSRGMRQLNGEYTQTLNRKRNRCGHIFQGRFKAVVIEKESHLLEVARYTVLNPVRAKSINISSPEEWPWSSYSATAGQTPPPKWLKTDWILGRFGKKKEYCQKAYRRFVSEGMKVGGGFAVKAGLWTGTEEFGEFLKELIRDKENIKEHPRMQRIIEREGLEKFFPPEALKNLKARNEAIFNAYTKGRFMQEEIANHLGLHYVTISRIVTAKEQARVQRDEE